MRAFALTAKTVGPNRKTKPPAEGGPAQVLYWCEKRPGFGLVVGRARNGTPPVMTWVAQKTVKGRTVRAKVGRFPDFTPEQAWERAAELLRDMSNGVNPNRTKRERGVTLAKAVELHVESMRARDCSPRSIRDIETRLGDTGHAKDWLARPLRDLSPDDIARRHARVTKNAGPVAANTLVRMIRAVYNTARKRYRDLPNNPAEHQTMNRQRRKRSPVPWADLPAWRAKVVAMENEIRRDLYVTILLTGLRSGDAKTMRWEHIDFGAGTVHMPRPKGGVDRAFTVPLPGRVLRLLRWRRRRNALILGRRDEGWVFPTRDRRGKVTHISEVKQTLYKDGRPVGQLPSPHRLRDTYIGAAIEAGVPMFVVKMLVNHALPSGDVTLGYFKPSVEHLRAEVEKVAGFLWSRTR